MGTLENGAEAIRTSQGHSKNAGVSSDYLPIVDSPGLLAHGTSLSNAESICKEGLNRGDRLQIHFGRIVHGRPVGIRPGSEVVIMVDGNACSSAGIQIRRSANDVYLAEGINGTIDPQYITQVFEPRAGEILYTNREGWANSKETPKLNRGERMGVHPRGSREGPPEEEEKSVEKKKIAGGDEIGEGSEQERSEEEKDYEWTFGTTKREYRRGKETVKEKKEESNDENAGYRRVKKIEEKREKEEEMKKEVKEEEPIIKTEIFDDDDWWGEVEQKCALQNTTALFEGNPVDSDASPQGNQKKRRTVKPNIYPRQPEILQ